MRKKRKKHNPISALLLIVAICVFLYAGFQLAEIAYRYWKVDNDNAELRKKAIGKGKKRKTAGASYDKNALKRKINFAYLRSVNRDIVGWIYIPHTPIDYPILHGTDNDEYLHHNYRHQYSFAGSIFMEATNNKKFIDQNTILYGHNMKNGSMFAYIKRYTGKSFMNAHPFAYVYLPDNSLNIYSVFSSAVIREDSKFYKTRLNYSPYVKAIRRVQKTGRKIDEKSPAPLLMMSTCSAPNTIYRTVAYGRLNEAIKRQ